MIQLTKNSYFIIGLILLILTTSILSRTRDLKRTNLKIEENLNILKTISDASNINYEVNKISSNVLQFILRQNGSQRFEMPKMDPFPYHKSSNSSSNFTPEYSIDFISDPFSLTVKRIQSGESVFSTANLNIIFKDNYAELTTILPSGNIFGLGERTTSFKLKPGVYTIYNRDAWGAIEDLKGGSNRYGSHPMYLMREQSGNYHVVYLRNTFPMDVILTNLDKTNTLTYKIIGGILDFTIFFGDTNPETAIKMYHKFLGGHTLPPFWSMGFHQCRWGYKNLEMIHDVLQKYQDNKLPLDTIWMDIDYMQEYVPFTVDETRYNITTFKTYLKNYRKKFIMIAEPAMSLKWPSYEYLVKGKSLDLFVKNSVGDYLINRVWPGVCYFIDYFHPNTEGYWHDALDKLHDKLDFSGVWLDMNEVATFVAGQVDSSDHEISCNDKNVYPYLPGNQPLERNTICPNAMHYNNMTHVQVHNYNPVAQQMSTHTYLAKKFPDQFPFIVSRANSAGTGKWSQHWTGDNLGTFAFYKASVSEVINNNIFGIPMVGADICGFAQNTEEILCSKFYQMGSLFPFSRSHSSSDTNRKEPWQMGPTLLETSRKSLNFRYQILKYYYSLFISNAGTGTVFKPVFFNFSNDTEALTDYVIDSQFMIGEELLIIPNFNDDNSTTTVHAYFPNGDWYDLRYNTKISSKGEYINIEAVLNEMPPVFLRGGKFIFTNNVDYVDNSYDLNTNFNFVLAHSNINNVYLSTGKIPALLNFHSRTKVESCMSNNCFYNVASAWTPSSLIFTIDITSPTYFEKDYSYINAISFKVFGVNIKGFTVLKTNLDDIVELSKLVKGKNEFWRKIHSYRKSQNKNFNMNSKDKMKKYLIEVVDENYFIIRINGSLKLQRDSLKITVAFK